RIATTTNPFLGGDEVALDAQMHGAEGAGNGLADYLFYFFFSPPRDCLDGGSQAYKKAKRQVESPDQAAVSPDLSIRTDCRHAPTLEGFYSRQLSPGGLVSSEQWRGARRRNLPGFLSGLDGDRKST